MQTLLASSVTGPSGLLFGTGLRGQNWIGARRALAKLEVYETQASVSHLYNSILGWISALWCAAHE